MNFKKLKTKITLNKKTKTILFICFTLLFFSFIIWPISQIYNQYGNRMIIFFLSFLVGFNIKQKKPSGFWLEIFFKSNIMHIVYYGINIFISLTLSIFSEHYIFQGLDIAIQIGLCTFLVLFSLKKIKYFLI